MKARRIVLAIIIILVLALLAIVVGFGKHFNTHYFMNTSLNGIDASNMTADEAIEAIQDSADEYLLTIKDINNNKYYITGADIGYTYTSSGHEEQILSAQNTLFWFTELNKTHEYTFTESLTYDNNKLEEAVKSLSCLDSDNMTLPDNAYITETENGYEIVPETVGTYLLYSKVLEDVKTAINNNEEELVLSADDYQKADITSDDVNLNSCVNQINNYLNTCITYDLGDETEVLDSSIIKDWIVVDTENAVVSIDNDKITQYVQSLATKYNTYADERQFETSLGDTITIGGGDYGWIVDKDAEYEQLLQELESGTVTTREINYQQRALYKGKDDIGNTYIEIDYTNQHLYYYEDGVLKIDDDIVSGNISKNNGSPDGVFKIVYKQSPAVLKGEDYESNVEYFMPFAYNVGIHDASWRSKFGGKEYLTSGSHGCVNMRESTVEKLYEVVAKGTPVIAYYRTKMELTSENAKISNAYSYVEKTDEETDADKDKTSTTSEEANDSSNSGN